MTRIGLIGAGYIAAVHGGVIRALPGATVSAVIDPNMAAAERLAGRLSDKGRRPAVFADAGAALAADALDRAHVLVPPDLHAAAALPVIAAGRPVLVEKPLAADSSACAAMRATARAAGTAVGVNQNFVHHPAFARLRARLARGELGPVRAVQCVYRMPLRQLAARQFGAWMFRAPVNILLEQAVHPLSQVFAVTGGIGGGDKVAALAGPGLPIAAGAEFFPQVDVSLGGAIPAQMHFAVGVEFPEWRLSVRCDDGTMTADMIANRCIVRRRTAFLDLIDTPLSTLATAAGEVGAAARNAASQALGMAGLGGDADPFRASMRASIAAFHTALDEGRTPALDLEFGAGLVAACERIAAEAFPRAPASTPAGSPPVATAPHDGPGDIAVLGGTGFIGTHLLRGLLAADRRVTILARSIRMLPDIFGDPRVRLVAGSIANENAVADAVGDAPVVVNLAHGGGGGDFAAVRDAMLGGAETVARVCEARDVRHLLHIGSIAALYLGDGSETITGHTPPDPRAAERAHYARAKALCDLRLLELHATQGLPVTILRPGVVVGEGGPAWHSGVGFFNNSQHILGWNRGTNPLPFVLAEDVAGAILAAAGRAESVGRCYNLVGDVRWTARRYVEELGTALGRRLRYHPHSPARLWLEELGKYAIKRAAGRAVAWPSYRDLLSRGLVAPFDCADAKRDLGWSPVADEAEFRRRAILVHVSGR